MADGWKFTFRLENPVTYEEWLAHIPDLHEAKTKVADRLGSGTALTQQDEMDHAKLAAAGVPEGDVLRGNTYRP